MKVRKSTCNRRDALRPAVAFGTLFKISNINSCRKTITIKLN